MEEKTNIDISSINSFAKYKAKMKELYGGTSYIENRAGTTRSSVSNSILKQDAQKLFNDAIANPLKAADISTAAYYYSNAYASIINYYKTLFYIRYTFVPRFVNNVAEIGQSTEEYDKIYYRMMEAVEGISLETILPNIAEETLIKGRCGVVVEKSTIGNTIVSFILPINYYKVIAKTQFGTKIIAFDYKYFDDIKQSVQGAGSQQVEGTDFEQILSTMPKVLQAGYKVYQQDTTNYRWQVLDPKTATQFDFNELAIPPKLGAFPASVDYAAYKNIKLDSAAQQLDKILTHQIPTNNDGDLILNIDEALDVAREIRGTLDEVPNLKVVTTFGKTELHDLQKDINEQNEVINTAYNNIFSSAGIDYNIFVNDTDSTPSLNRDKAFMWEFYQKVMLFYNIALNNLINFGLYQARITLLPITTQNSKEEIKDLIDYAGAGVGRLNAVVATGIKQVDIIANSEVEEFLKLDEILKPLQSMYTTSNEGKTNDSKSQDSKNESDSKETKEEPEEKQQ